jgi:hypothetical protein
MKYIVAIVFLASALRAFPQKQLILIKGEKVLLRLYPGDEITFKVRGSNAKRISYINNLFDTALVAHRDVISLYKVERIYFDQKNFLNVIGGVFVLAGVGYVAIDQINLVLVNKESFQVDKSVGMPAAVLVGLGLPMVLLRKKSQRIGGRYRLMVVDKGSAFYRPQWNK